MQVRRLVGGQPVDGHGARGGFVVGALHQRPHRPHRLVTANDAVRTAPDELTARRLLASVWRKRVGTRRALEDGALAADPAAEAIAQVSTRLSLAMLADPAFDDLPLYAAGLRPRAGTSAPAQWVGRRAQIAEAIEWLRARGLRDEYEPGGRTRVYRGPHQLATLVEDPAHRVADDETEPPPERVGLRWLAVLLALGAVITLLLALVFVAIGLLAAAVLAWLAHRLVHRRRIDPRRWRTAHLSPATGTAGDTPYRDAHGREHISDSELADALRTAGFASTRRGATLQLTTADGQPLRLLGATAANVDLVRLELRYRDVPAAAAFAHALTAVTGALTLRLADRTLTATRPDAYPTWLRAHQRDAAARADLVTALERGRYAAFRCL